MNCCLKFFTALCYSTCDMSNQPMIACELLAYVATYRKKSTELNLRMAVLQHYTLEEIQIAKVKMEDNVKELIPNFPHLGKKRTDSPNRTASEAMICDILEMFKWLDSVGDDAEIPVFVAVDVSRLPSASPESAADMMSVMESLASQQRQLQQLQEAMTTMRRDVDQNKSKIESQGPKRQQLNPPSEVAVNKVEEDEGDEDAAAAAGATGSANLADGAEGDEHRMTKDTKKSYVDKVKETAVDGVGPFLKAGKRPNKGSSQVKSKPQRVSGTSESAMLRAGPQSFQVQITNINKEVSEEDIKKYIASVKDGNLQAQKVEDLTSEGWDTKRFVLTFDVCHMDTVMAQDFWPKRIYFKRWFPSRGSRLSVL